MTPPTYHLVVDGEPPKLSGYLRSAMFPRRGFQPDAAFPTIRISRPDLPIRGPHLDQFAQLCRWPVASHMPLIYPLTLLFHYHLGIFAHPSFPCSLRQLLGFRNHVVRRRRVGLDERVDVDVRTVGRRILSKGVEFDFHSTLSSGGKVVWESVHVYYLRGAYNGNDEPAPAAGFETLGEADFEVGWNAPTNGKWQFARFSGDLNPVHYFAPWARLLGFRGDFAHTQRVVADCLRRLPEAPEIASAESQRLDVAFKGPVYYGSRLNLKGTRKPDGVRFDLYCGDIDKPAMPGRLRLVPADHDLFGN